MSNSEDQFNEMQQNLKMFLKEWVQVMEENRDKVLADVLVMIAEEDMDVENQMMRISSTNPVLDHLMKIAKEDFEMWTQILVMSKTLMASLFSLHSGPSDHSVLSVSYGVDRDPCHELMQVIGVIQQFEAQSAQVMDGWMNYHLNREQLKGGLLVHEVHPDVLVNSDLYAALLLLDMKEISSIKSNLSDLLNNYSVLMDVFGAATAHMHEDEDVDFEAMYM